ncbi:MAG: hypothetical protein LBT01_00050 [Spirochaetaceae bacterium]|jgi:hypothetical protein|nr:hypothetical protein [Spirochaetaceae bacterium]
MFFSSGKSGIEKCKQELIDRTNEELEIIKNGKSHTSLFIGNGKQKDYELAAYEILRERRNTKK